MRKCSKPTRIIKLTLKNSEQFLTELTYQLQYPAVNQTEKGSDDNNKSDQN